MKKVMTSDGSSTFYSENVDETYHSTTGAKEEAIEKYAKPCRISEREEVVILDYCFGLGYNSAAALDMFKGKRITIIGLENDPEILSSILLIDYPFSTSTKEIIYGLTKEKRYEDGLVSARLLVGDARITIDQVPDNYVDVVFFDPFSPKKCPELWTAEVFSAVYQKMKKGGMLATYSCAGMVRRNMKSAGFKVSDGPSVGRKSPSTIALK